MMTPYYDKDGIVIYHGDCRDVLPALRGSIDSVVTDPPWKATKHPFVHRRPGDGRGVAKTTKTTRGLRYGDIGEFDPQLIADAYSSARADVLVMCGYLELSEVIAACHKLRGVFVWHNTKPVPIPGPVAARDVSFIVWGGEKSLVDPSRCRWKSSLFRVGSLQAGCMATERILDEDGSTAHPAQEPLELMGELIAPLSEGLILDPFMGSGTTLRAAKDLGRKAIGIEIEERYCEIAAKRMEQQVFQFV